MRTAIKLILLNLLIAQIIAPILVMIPCVIYLVATTGNLDEATGEDSQCAEEQIRG